MKTKMIFLSCVLLLLVSVSPSLAETPHATYYGRYDAYMTKVLAAISDSLDARLDSLDTTWRLWSRIDGSEKDATHGWFSDLHTGLFRFGTHRMGITAGGTSRAIIDSNGVSAFPGLRLAPSQYSDYADSALTITLVSGSPKLSFFGSDADAGDISMDTSDRLLFRNFGGGYDFDADPSVGLSSAWIDSGNIVDGAVSNGDLRDDAITGSKIQANAIDSTDVKDGSLSGTDLIDDAITAAKIEEEVIDSTHVKNGSISNDDLRNDAVTGSKIQASAIDSTDVKDASLSVGDIANGNNGFVTKPSFVDSANAEIKRMFFPRRLALPTIKDSTINGTIVCLNDSIWLQPYAKMTTWPDSGLFHRGYNEAAGGQIDTLTVGGFDHLPAANDSFVVYIRTDAVDSAFIDVTIKGANGTTVLTQAVTPTVANAWERFVYYRAAAVIPQDYLITYRYRCYAGHYIDATPVTAKCAN